MAQRILLSIDGGGIRGIIPLCMLVELEKQTGRAARDVFSFMAGTSTGSIIAGGLAVGLSAEHMLDLYQQLGTKVFNLDVWGFITNLGSFRYRTKPLATLLQSYYGDVALNDLPVDVLLPATRVSDGKAWYFVRDNPCNGSRTGTLKLVDCVAASSAAPTYFDPWDVPTVGPCVDGGVGIAGNPIYQACVEAFYYSEPGKYNPADTIVVSLGTGHTPTPAAPHNLLEWVGWIVGELLMLPAEQQTQIVRRHFNTAATYRFNPELSHDIDMSDVKSIPELLVVGKEIAATLDWNAVLAAQPVPQAKGLIAPRH
jgi:uncharacterized protein